MNSLERYIRETGENGMEVMRQLQGESNTISDNCQNPEDVAECDAIRAVEWLRKEASAQPD